MLTLQNAMLVKHLMVRTAFHLKAFHNSLDCVCAKFAII